jgi:hypothetical protein
MAGQVALACGPGLRAWHCRVCMPAVVGLVGPIAVLLQEVQWASHCWCSVEFMLVTQ